MSSGLLAKQEWNDFVETENAWEAETFSLENDLGSVTNFELYTKWEVQHWIILFVTWGYKP